MKLQAIKRVCKDAETFCVIDSKQGGQWVGDGAAFYPVEGIRLSEDNIQAVFDLSEKQVREYAIRSMANDDDVYGLEPVTGEEIPACMEPGQYILHSEAVYRVLLVDGRVALINESYMRPARTKDDVYRFAVRHTRAGQMVIAVYVDMLASALITPVSQALAERMLAELTNVTGRTVAQTKPPEKEEVA